jgi:hypothetical protein
MRAYVRRAVVSAALVSAVALTGCSSGGDADTASSSPEASASIVAEPIQEPSPSPSASVPVLSVGQTGTYETGEVDDYGENYKVTSTMSVTVVSAKYVTPEEVGTSNKPQGQYVALKLTFKNVGQAPARVMTYGGLQWEDASTAAQSASTLEGVGEGPDVDTEYKPGQSVTGTLILDIAHRGGVVSYDYTNDPAADVVFQVKLPAA